MTDSSKFDLLIDGLSLALFANQARIIYYFLGSCAVTILFSTAACNGHRPLPLFKALTLADGDPRKL